MRWSARLIAVIAAVGMMFAAAPAFAQDIKTRFDAKVRVLANGSEFEYHGRVRSSLEACQVGRTVRITTSGREIGITSTGDDGRFSLRGRTLPEGSSVKFKVKPNEDCDPLKLFVEI